MKHSLLFSPAFIFVVALGIVSCNPKTDTYLIDEDNKAWLILTEENGYYLMTDSHGITQSFVQSPVSCSFLEGESYVAFIRTHSSLRESCYAFSASTYGNNLNVLISASYPPLGDVISIRLNNLSFRYDLKLKQIIDIEIGSPPARLSRLTLENGYSIEPQIYSVVQIIPAISQNGLNYENVMHFTLNDLIEAWTPSTIREFKFAKGRGLVWFKLNNGLEFYRIPNT